MGLARFVSRAVGGLVALGVLAFVVLPVVAVGLPLILLAVAAVVGAALLFTVGLPVLLIGRLVSIALGALISLRLGVASLGTLMLKPAFVAILVSWLFRLAFPRRAKAPGPVLVGRPIAEVAAPRDRYEVEAERELDKEL